MERAAWYVAGAVFALYLNIFVGVVQAFQKLPFLKPLAPTQSEPPFLVAQLLVMALFIVLGIKAVRSFHPVLGAIFFLQLLPLSAPYLCKINAEHYAREALNLFAVLAQKEFEDKKSQ